MPRELLGAAMARRADGMAAWLRPHLPSAGRVLDIGAGTGHTAAALGGAALRVTGLDVVSMHVVGPPPVVFDGERMPFADGAFDAALLLFVLQYVPDPALLLREAGRVCRGPILLVQSTYRGALGQAALRLNDLAWGPAAFAVARAAGMVSAERHRLFARDLATRESLARAFTRAGLEARLAASRPWRLAPVDRDLFVLRRGASVPNCSLIAGNVKRKT